MKGQAQPKSRSWFLNRTFFMFVLGHSGKVIQLGACGENDRFTEVLYTRRVQV